MASTAFRQVGKVIQCTWANAGPGFDVLRFPEPLRTSPFLNIDHFVMSVPTFRPHPHAGFSAVTLSFEDSEGSVANRDSLGAHTRIKPGDLQWTTAAGGIVHEEVPETPGIPCHGLQIFCNLPASLKRAPARADHLSAEDVPIYTSTDGARVRVLAGSTNGISSPLNQHLLMPATVLDIHLPPSSSFLHEQPATDNLTILVIKGQVDVGGKVLSKDQACDFEQGPGVVKLQAAGDALAEVVLLAGAPLTDPVVWHGPFCGVSREQVIGYVSDYQAGKMGSLKASF